MGNGGSAVNRHRAIPPFPISANYCVLPFAHCPLPEELIVVRGRHSGREGIEADLASGRALGHRIESRFAE